MLIGDIRPEGTARRLIPSFDRVIRPGAPEDACVPRQGRKVRGHDG